MRAIQICRFGGPEGLEIGEVPDPLLPVMGVRVEVRAASLNHLDLWVRRGLPGILLPRIPGADAAGVVLEVGMGVTGIQPGDRVILDPGSSCRICRFCTSGEPSMCSRYGILGEHGDGTHAQQVVVDAAQVLPLPSGLDFIEAASLPLTLLTAWRMMITRGRLTPGERVFIHSAAAGVGVMAVQIARMVGAKVIASASTTEKRQQLFELGVANVLDSQDPLLGKKAKSLCPEGYDVVVDYIGKSTWVSSLRMLRNGGRLLTCGATSGWNPETDLRHVFYRQMQIIGSTMGNRAELEAALQAVQDGFIRPQIGRVFSFSEVRQAHTMLENREVGGKIILVPDEL